MAGTPANLQEALQAQRAMVAENPTDADLLNDLGNLLALAGNLDEAHEVYLRALEIDPDDISTLYNLALVLMEQGQTKQAHKVLRSILELEPQHAWGHYQLGTLYNDQNNRAKAVHHYAEAFAIDRSLTSPKVNPHIVENSLATEALLKMYVEESPSTQAPRMYEEPGNVADLLLPQKSVEPTADPESESEPVDAPEEAAEPPARRHRASYSSPPAADEDSAATSDRSDAQLVTGQRERQDSTPAQIIEDPESEPPRAAGLRIKSTENAAQQTEETESRGEFVEPSSGPDTSVGDPIDSPGGFLPGLQSTGRLDIELLPAVEPGSAVSPT
jgi:hypothetical protein